MPHQFSTVCKVLDLKPKLFNQWLHRKHINVEFPAEGKGARREFGTVNICQIELFKRLADDKVNLKRASEIAFSDVVQKEFERQVDGATSLNYLRKASTPVVQLVCMKGANGEIEMAVVENGQQLAKLYRSFAKAKISTVINLTEIAFDVTEALAQE